MEYTKINDVFVTSAGQVLTAGSPGIWASISGSKQEQKYYSPSEYNAIFDDPSLGEVGPTQPDSVEEEQPINYNNEDDAPLWD